MRHKPGSFLIGLGSLLLIGSFLLALFNLWDSRRAQRQSQEILMQLTSPAPTEAPQEETPERVWIDEDLMPEEEQPDLSEFPAREMPTEEIDGYRYIGVLEIPGLGLSLPVMEEWDYPRLRIAPCRYAGSAYRDDLVIAAHNYPAHFGNLHSLPLDSEISFTDVDGTQFLYLVRDIEILQPSQTEEMVSGEWDLTLFTCTLGGGTRVTLRCERVS